MKYKLYEEKIGKTFHIIFYLLCYIIPITLLTYYFILTKSYKEEYQSITEFNSEILNEIKTQEDIKKFDNDKLKDLALRVFKFADLGYEKRAKEKENIFPESFMNWEIINYKLIRHKYFGTDNFFYVLKDPKNKKLIVTFPGTFIMGFQLIEEVLGSSLKSFHLNNKDILISQYFGERISEILDYIFTPEVNELLNENYQIISTGHSLGGAIAQAFIYFALVNNKINKNNIPLIITFNQPRVGNIFFAKFLESNSLILRFTKGADIVSSIPFCNFNLIDIINYFCSRKDLYNQYIHAEGELNISNDSNNISKLINHLDSRVIIIIWVILYILFVYKILHIFGNIMKNVKNNHNQLFDELEIILGFLFVIFLIFYFIIFLCIFYYILKYKTFFFIIIPIIVFFVNLYSTVSITFLFLLLINKFLIFVINVYLNFLNLFIDERPVKRFDKKKFKNSSEEDQVSFLVSCSYLATGLLGANIVKKNVLSHMETPQRTGNEKIIFRDKEVSLNNEKLSPLLEELEKAKDDNEMGLIILKYQKDLFKLSN